jgi:SAM-dependent methyltransferase
MPALLAINALYHAKRVLYSVSHQVEDEDAAFDRHHGTDTAGVREISSLRLHSVNARFAVRYQPTASDVFDSTIAALKAFEPDLRQFVFVDFGCGKGKLLLLASLLPFREVIGVELSAELVAIAQRNIETWCSQKALLKTIRVVHADAADFPPPPEPVVSFFYNPFGRPVMEKVLANLTMSLHENPRPMAIIYVDPRHADVLERSGTWECRSSTATFRIYSPAR